MPAYSDSELGVQIAHSGALSPVQFATLGSTLAVLGVASIWPAMVSLWTLWTTDALKSIGMVVPVVSLVLILRAWRAIGWEAKGSWWGLGLLLFAMAAVQLQRHIFLVMVISPQWQTVVPPPSLILLIYGSGAALLLGGTRLFRAAFFPILLLWFANPVPHVFTSRIDLPLQHAAAQVARSFAVHLGHSLTPDALRLMFTPDFGMFIAPGCDGIRGSVTMGFIALIAGYVYRFRWYANALVVLGAILLGYIFNLVRLCLLVLYYAVALHLSSLQNKAETADYIIGAALFLIATVLLFTAIHRLRDSSAAKSHDVAAPSETGESPEVTPSVRYSHLAAIGAIVLLGCASFAQAKSSINPFATPTKTETVQQFPQHIGNYALERSWTETGVTGSLVYVWAQYLPAGGGTPVAVGISPDLDWHDPIFCHFSRGDNPLWHGQLTFAPSGVVPMVFSSAFYNDGVTQYLEASTICNGPTCSEFATKPTHFGFVYTRTDAGSLLGGAPKRLIPVLLRVETTDMALTATDARDQLTSVLQAFLQSVRLDDLTRPYEH